MFPKLRFKKFDGDWTAVTLESLAEVERGKFSVRPRNDPRYFGGEMPFIQTGDVTGSDVYLKGYTQTLNDDGIRVSKVFPADTILITIAANIGDTTITQYPVACPDSVVAIQPKQDKVNTIFLKNVIDLQKDNLDSQATQNAQKNINLQVLKPLKLIVPSKEEQNKIASFLSAVDEKISQLTQKLELLSQYKQGMMQKLFSQQIRFKADDGSEFGEWGEYKIFDLAIDKTLNNGVFNDQNKVGKGYKLINVLDMYIQRDIDESRLSLLDIDKKEFERNKVNYGDIFFTRSSLVKEGIAFSNVYLGVSNDITYDGHLIKLSPDLNIIEPKFLNYCLKVAYVRKQLIQGGKTATMTTIGQQEVGNTLVKIPCLEEQIRIANFLSAIDQKIDVVSKQIEQAKQWKKGLLQQMFI